MASLESEDKRMRELRAKELVEKKVFVEGVLSQLLHTCKPNLVRCEYEIWNWDEVVTVHCENGYTYKVNVSANSLIAIAEAVISKMVHK